VNDTLFLLQKVIIG